MTLKLTHEIENGQALQSTDLEWWHCGLGIWRWRRHPSEAQELIYSSNTPWLASHWIALYDGKSVLMACSSTARHFLCQGDISDAKNKQQAEELAEILHPLSYWVDLHPMDGGTAKMFWTQWMPFPKTTRHVKRVLDRTHNVNESLSLFGVKTNSPMEQMLKLKKVDNGGCLTQSGAKTMVNYRKLWRLNQKGWECLMNKKRWEPNVWNQIELRSSKCDHHFIFKNYQKMIYRCFESLNWRYSVNALCFQGRGS